ncbi:MAG: ABC transporter substrate-binding protein [Proteobacteria bacterium]|nr:ABC transporter substrate-binding protein [Pseudomonadota bacterium]
MKLSTLLAAGVVLAGAILNSSAVFAQAPAAAPAQTNNQQPSEIVQASAQGILKDLDANRDLYRKDPSKISGLVDKYLLPHFDTEYAARLVLAKYWRTATDDQKKRFIDAFYHSLLSNYGAALAEFTADRLKVFPSNVSPTDDHATVRTEVKRDNGDRIAVNYELRKEPGGWKAYDVNIDGISYVKSYREDFGAQIEQKGIESVISRLQKGEKPDSIKKTTDKTS